MIGGRGGCNDWMLATTAGVRTHRRCRRHLHKASKAFSKPCVFAKCALLVFVVYVGGMQRPKDLTLDHPHVQDHRHAQDKHPDDQQHKSREKMPVVDVG